MADSDTSPDIVTGQDAGTVAATAGQPTGTQDAGGSDQAAEVASESQPSAELDEIERVLSAGGEEAVKMGKHFQQVSSRHGGELSKFKPLEDLVTRLGGAENARDFLLQYDFVMSHPKAKEDIMSFLQTREWKSAAAPDNQGLDDFEDEPDPTTQRLDALERAIGNQNVKTASQDMRSHMASFFGEDMKGTPLGELLKPEEKTKIMTGLENQIRGLGNNASGQQTLQNLNAETVKRMMQLQIPMEQWADIGERAHLQKIERKKGAATGAVSTTGTTGNEDRVYSGNLAQDVSDYAKELGVDLNSPGWTSR